MAVAALYTKIEKIIQLANGSIVLESPNGFPLNESNLYLVEQNGNILWKAEKPDIGVYFSRVKLNEDGMTFSSYTTRGHACELNLKTGKLISFTSIQ